MKTTISASDWKHFPQTYRLHLGIVPEQDGGFSAICLNLPGAGGCGESRESAIADAKSGAAAAIETYLDDKVSIPWSADYEVPNYVFESIWVTVSISGSV